MSYCRWSSDCFQCDVYVYKDASGGLTTHVADRRCIVPDEIKNMATGNTEEWLVQHKAVMNYLEENEEWVDLEGEFVGKTFNDPTPGECADRLEEIRASGLNVPQYAIEALREEAEQ